MIRFVQLYKNLDSTNSTLAKIAHIEAWLAKTDKASGAWGIWYLCGKKQKRVMSSTLLRQWVAEDTGLPNWLVDESYRIVGDLAETLALLSSHSLQADHRSLDDLVRTLLTPLQEMTEEQRKSTLLEYWSTYSADCVFLFNKLLTGGFRVGVSQRTVAKAISNFAGISEDTIIHRLLGKWQPSEEFFDALVAPEGRQNSSPSMMYPFQLAAPLERGVEALETVEDWQAEWKWDGIRAQVVCREGECWIWSRGEEPIAAQFPEIQNRFTPNNQSFVLDGEILCWDHQQQLPDLFEKLQVRIGRKKPSEKIIKSHPTLFVAWDLLEKDGLDLRARPLKERRELLESLHTSMPESFRLSPVIEFSSWQDLSTHRLQANSSRVEGLMLKRLDGSYKTGRKRGEWWKWKLDPLSIDAVLIYAQAGHGRRGGLFTDYTFALWLGDELVPIGKAYSGLNDEEIRELDRWIKANVTEKFGPVRKVPPLHVFELAFEGVRRSTRHKSGFALRFPRISRWRRDKTPAMANSLSELEELWKNKYE